ncbi:MAG: serine protease [Nitrospira sp.]|nr:serine protease [Nitrospira sp.]
MSKSGLGTIFLLLPVFILSMFGAGIYLDSQSFNTPRSTIRFLEIETDISRGSCSGVAISEKQVLTAAHCINPPVPLKSVTVDGKPAKVVRFDEFQDIALLEVEEGHCPCSPIAAESPDRDQRVVAIGWPLGKAQVATEGRYQGLIDEGGRYMTLSTNNIMFGNSGGGLFAFNYGRWELVGIINGMSGASMGFFGIPVFYMALSTPVENIRHFLYRQ